VAVRDYNIKVRTFPANLVATATGFKTATPYEAAPEAAAAPRVDFGKKPE